MSAVNLLEETLEALREAGKSPADVLWVGSRDGAYAVSWDEFCAIARNTEYEKDSGAPEIAWDLVIAGDGWWLERREYDGSEWWEFKTTPAKRLDAKPFSLVRHIPRVYEWWGLESINEKDGRKEESDRREG